MVYYDTCDYSQNSTFNEYETITPVSFEDYSHYNREKEREERERIENNLHNKIIQKIIKSFYDMLPKKKINIIIPFKVKKYSKKQNIGINNFRKSA